jgi:imidazolonepropionase-like amidohydrolase
MNRIIPSVALLAALAVMAPVAARAQALVIDGGTVHPMSGAPYVGRVVVENGVITAAGPAAAVPAGATRIDATGRHVYPGIFDALGTLGLIEINSVSATDDQAEMGRYNPHLLAATAIHPPSEVIPVTRANGVTHAIVAPNAGRDGVIAGQAALVNLDGWTVEEMAIDPAVALVINWPAIVTRRFDNTTFEFKETPFNDAREEAQKKENELREWFEAARHYRQAAGKSGSRAETDPKLAALAGYLDRARPVAVVAQAKRDIEAAIAFCDAMDLKMILVGGTDAWKVKATLATKGIPVILGRPQSLPRDDDDPYHLPFSAAAALHGAGVKVAFASGVASGFEPRGAHSARTLPYEAATAAAFGLPAEDAMKAITLWPAEIFGVEKQLGSIEAGKIANLIVTDGDPLDIRTRVDHVVIAGREVSLENKHHGLYEKYRSRPRPVAGGAK